MKNFVYVFLLALGFLNAGCSTVMTRSFPGTEDSYQIAVTDKHAPEGDWAPGAYSLGKTNVCFAKTQGEKDPDTAQALFGLIGRAIAVGDMAGELKKMIQGQDEIFTLDLKGITQENLKRQLHSSDADSRFTAAPDWKTAPLQITPYAVFSFIDKEKARFWLVLRLDMIDPASKYGKKKWSCRYLVGLGEPRPLVGDGGWASNNGKLLETTVQKDTALAVKVMLEDLEGNLRTGKEPKDGLWANWAFYKKAQWADIQKLKSEKDWDIVLPLVEDEEFFAGVNVVPKDFSLPAPPDKNGGWGN